MEIKPDGFTARTEETFEVDIYIGGDISVAKQVCREYCMAVGLCVTVEPVTYIYTGGQEEGIRIHLMVYPRFPTDYVVVGDHAYCLAKVLRERLCQWSFSIVDKEQTVWYSARPSDAE